MICKPNNFGNKQGNTIFVSIVYTSNVQKK